MPPPNPRLRDLTGRSHRYSRRIKTFLYLHSSDVSSYQRFYSKVLGLKEIFDSAEGGKRTVGYSVGELQLTISDHADAVAVDGWAAQLGWDGGSIPVPSWGFELPADEFRRVVDAVRAQGIQTLHDAPVWVGYWSFPVRDPMGYTVEISTPAPSAWPANG